MSPRPPAIAVVVDEWPLVRLGIGQALRGLSVRVAIESPTGAGAVRAAEQAGAGWLFLGTFRDVPVPDVVGRATDLDPRPRVVVLLEQASRDILNGLMAVGADALLTRTAGADELLDAVARVERGERFVSPTLLPLLVASAQAGSPPAHVAPAAEPDGALTRKELEVLTRVAQGRSNKEIADDMYVTPATVKTHLTHIYMKLGVAGRQEAIARAVELGLLR